MWLTRKTLRLSIWKKANMVSIAMLMIGWCDDGGVRGGPRLEKRCPLVSSSPPSPAYHPAQPCDQQKSAEIKKNQQKSAKISQSKEQDMRSLDPNIKDRGWVASNLPLSKAMWSFSRISEYAPKQSISPMFYKIQCDGQEMRLPLQCF